MAMPLLHSLLACEQLLSTYTIYFRAERLPDGSFPVPGSAPELRLLVYSELLERKNPDSQKRLFPAVLATSREIYRDAGPELYTKTNLRLTIKATALKSRDWTTNSSLHVGQCNKPILATLDTDTTISAWDLYNTPPPALGKISNMTLQIVLSAQRHRGLLKHKLLAEQLNQVHQILTALSAIWMNSGALRALKIEFGDDTGNTHGPPSPHSHMMYIPAGEMERTELKRIFRPLCRLSESLALHGTTLPSAVMEYIVERPTISESGLHPFEVYNSLKARVDAVVATAKDAGLCCTQLGCAGEKPCAARRLERKLKIAREGIIFCHVRSESQEEELTMDLDAVREFLESRKVQDLVEMVLKKEHDEAARCVAASG